MASAEVLQASRWKRDQPPQSVVGRLACESEAVLWIEILASSAEAEPERLVEQLGPVCGQEVVADVVKDALRPDERPEITRYGDETVRSVSAVAIFVDDSEGADQRDSWLVSELAELFAGEGWLLAAWHGGRSLGSREAREGALWARGRVRKKVEKEWIASGGRTAGDLAILVLRELTRTYPRARRSLRDRLERWEMDYFEQPDEGKIQPLVEFRNLLGRAEQALSGLDVRRAEAERAWFSNVTLEQLAADTDQLIDRSLEDIRDLEQIVRSDFELMHSYVAAKQLETAERQRDEAEKQREQSERLSRLIELIAAVFLVPALIAAVYGANTKVPAEHTWRGFALMVGAMTVAVFLSVTAFALWSRRRSRQAISQAPQRERNRAG